MSDDANPCPSPATAEHHSLKESAGKWNVDCEFYMDPSQPPMKLQATETVELLGELWTVSLFEADIMGQPMLGRATLGYEPVKERWVGTWIDTMSPFLFHFTGCFDESGKVLTMTGEGPAPGTNQWTTFRTTEERLGPDERKFEMFMALPDGSDYKMFSYTYRRAS